MVTPTLFSECTDIRLRRALVPHSQQARVAAFETREAKNENISTDNCEHHQSPLSGCLLPPHSSGLWPESSETPRPSELAYISFQEDPSYPPGCSLLQSWHRHEPSLASRQSSKARKGRVQDNLFFSDSFVLWLCVEPNSSSLPGMRRQGGGGRIRGPMLQPSRGMRCLVQRTTRHDRNQLT